MGGDVSEGITSKDLFDAQIEVEVEKRLAEELERIADRPEMVIAAYAKKLEQTQREMGAMHVALAPKARFADAVMQADDWSEMSTVAKLLARPGFGRNNIFQLLRDRQILRYNNEPYQSYVERGYFKIVEQHWENPHTTETMIAKKTVVSQKGIDFIRKILDEEGA